MQRTIAVFDDDQSRLLRMETLLAEDSRSEQFAVLKTTSIDKLQGMMDRHEAGVVVADVRADLNGCDTIDVMRRLCAAHSAVQLVLVGVDESCLARASSIGSACLLPTQYDSAQLVDAVQRALVEFESQLELPLLIQTRGHLRLVLPGRVRYIESDRRKIRIHEGDDVIEVYQKISSLGQELPNSFVQCHKSFLVNLGYVQRMDRDCMVLSTGECVPVSQKRRRAAQEAFTAYVGRAI